MSDDFIINLEDMKPFIQGDGAIVVIDDDPSQIRIVKTCYERSGRENELICMLCGEEFLEWIEVIKAGKKSMPELILLDINMPKKSGFDVLKAVRSLEGFRERPIIMMFSSSDSVRDIEKSKELQANAFFSKPVHVFDYIRFFQSV